MQKNLLWLILPVLFTISCEKINKDETPETVFAKVKSFTVESYSVPENEGGAFSLKNARALKVNATSEFIKQQRYEIQLDENQNKTLVKTVYYDDQGNPNYNYKTTYQYNNIGKLGGENSYRNEVRIKTIAYSYNSDFSQLLHLEERDSYNYFTKQEFLDYDSKGRYCTIKSSSKNGEQTTYTLSYTSDIKYDDRNFVTEEIKEYEYDGDKDTATYTYQYDAKGNVTNYHSIYSSSKYQKSYTNIFDLEKKTDNIYRALVGNKALFFDLHNDYDQSFGVEYYLQEQEFYFNDPQYSAEHRSKCKLRYSFDEGKNLKKITVFLIVEGQEIEYVRLEITDLVLY